MSWDVVLFQAANGLATRSTVVDSLMLMLGAPGNLLIPGTLVLGYWLWARGREVYIGAPVLTGLIVAGDFLGAQVKLLVERVRPCHVLAGVHELAGCGGAFSFPSNHALNTSAAAAFAQVLYPSSGWVTWPLVAAIGFSRVYVGVHYVSDVLGGWAIGGSLGAAAALLLVRWPSFRVPRLENAEQPSRD